MGVYRKLQEARIRLNAQEVKKGARNEFAKYNYLELADFLLPTQQIFAELGLCGIVSFAADLATLTITDFDTGAQILITSPMSTAALKGCHEVQNLGAVQTYLRRYLWVAAMEIVEHDAIDSAPQAEAKKVQPPGPNHAPAKAAMIGVEIPPEIMAQLRTLAMDLVHYVEACNDPVTAYNTLQECKLGADELPVAGDYLLALNEILAPNSKTRAGLKAEGKARREAAKSKDLAGAM